MGRGNGVSGERARAERNEQDADAAEWWAPASAARAVRHPKAGTGGKTRDDLTRVSTDYIEDWYFE